MAALLLGESEPGCLSGAYVPRIGTHVIPRDGGASELTGGLMDVYVEQRRRLRTGARWRCAFEYTLEGAGEGMDAVDLLQRYGAAADVLRDASGAARLRNGPHDGRRFASVYADVEGDAPAVVLQSMQEAVEAVGFSLSPVDEHVEGECRQEHSMRVGGSYRAGR